MSSGRKKRRGKNANSTPTEEKIEKLRSPAGLIADILQQRGELDEALRIRREEELPVYERLGDVRERAVTMGKIADILQAARRVGRGAAHPARGSSCRSTSGWATCGRGR